MFDAGVFFSEYHAPTNDAASFVVVLVGGNTANIKISCSSSPRTVLRKRDHCGAMFSSTRSREKKTKAGCRSSPFCDVHGNRTFLPLAAAGCYERSPTGPGRVGF